MREPAVYILSNKKNGTLYTGVTSNLEQRMSQYKAGSIDGFSKQYGCNLLVYFERFDTMEYAILREKQIKDGPRKRKIALIEKMNPTWNDLYLTIV